jgi:biopolymer transport protein ExbB
MGLDMVRTLLLSVLLLCPVGAGAQDGAQDGAAPLVETDVSSFSAPELQANELSSAQPGTPSVPAPSQPATETALSAAPLSARTEHAANQALTFLTNGGPALWAIAGLSVITLALILWKIWRLVLIGAWSYRTSQKAVALYENGDAVGAMAMVKGRRSVRSRVVTAALQAIETMPDSIAREETARTAKAQIARARTGLGALELISTIAPLLGLLGTVLGMIAAFQALQAAGSRADPALLAGGIWEALLTTAAGMAVAIPASAALTWFESVIDKVRRDLEDSATRLFVAEKPKKIKLAAE